MKNKLLIIFLLWVGICHFEAQVIGMDFPHFAGKSYDFVLFQGDEQKTIQQGVIPEDGKFTLTVPKEYSPYRGMSRWLITGTAEGGGLDMIISGKDFSVSCKEAQPSDKNILYSQGAETPKLNSLYQQQQDLFSRYESMKLALRSFPKGDKSYKVFDKEYDNQLKAYSDFQNVLSHDNSYASGFLRIVNATLGVGTKLLDSEQEKARNINGYITGAMDWEELYTSGHWGTVISSWVDMHTQVLKDSELFTSDFKKLSQKIEDPKLYTDFVSKLTLFLSQKGKDDLIGLLTPMVTGSGKMTGYEGSLAVYTQGVVGSQGSDLMISSEEGGKGTLILKSSELSGSRYMKTLLVFYGSECGPCESLVSELPKAYEKLKNKGVRLLLISSDQDKELFLSKSKDFPWKEDTYCDYNGMKGINFKNYGVLGTPTLILLDKGGKIEKRSALLEDMLKVLN